MPAKSTKTDLPRFANRERAVDLGTGAHGLVCAIDDLSSVILPDMAAPSAGRIVQGYNQRTPARPARRAGRRPVRQRPAQLPPTACGRAAPVRPSARNPPYRCRSGLRAGLRPPQLAARSCRDRTVRAVRFRSLLQVRPDRPHRASAAGDPLCGSPAVSSAALPLSASSPASEASFISCSSTGEAAPPVCAVSSNSSDV